MSKKNNDRATSLGDVISKIKEKGGSVQRLSGKGDYTWKNTRLPQDADLTPENIKEQIKHNREMDQLIGNAKKWQEEQARIIKEEAKKKITQKPDIPTNAIYNKKGQLSDLSGNPFKKLKTSLVGILPGLAAAALSAYSPESKAATVAKTVSRVVDEGDPTSMLIPGGVGEGEEDEVARMREEAKSKYYDNLMKNVPKNEKVRSEELKNEIEPVVNLLGNKSPIKEMDAEEMAGEVPYGQEDSLSIEDTQRKMRKKLGYE